MATGTTIPVGPAGGEPRGWQRVRWGAVFAGLVIALVTQMLLTVLGLAVGLTAVDPRAGAPGAGFRWGAAVWGVVTLLCALFVGGYVAGRFAGVWRKEDGAMNGVLVWALSLLAAVWLVSVGVGSLLSGAFSMMATVTQVAGTAVVQGAAQSATSGQDVAQQAARQAQETAQQIGQSGTPANQQAKETAARATGYAATGAWSLLIAALLGLAAAAWGGAVGARGAAYVEREA